MERWHSFLTSQSDPAEAFDPVEETLGQMALPVEHSVDLLRGFARRVLFDLRYSGKIFCNELAQMIRIICRVRHDMATPVSPSIRPRA